MPGHRFREAQANTTGLEHIQSSASGPKRRTYDALEYTRNRMGLKPSIETRPGTHNQELSWWPRMRLIFREPLLEFWGTLVMMLLGGSFGNWLTICFGWSAAMIFGIYVAGDSGAYLNPAITLTNCLFRGLPLRRWPVYAAAQFLGAFCGHGLYEGHGIRTIPPSPTSSAKIFCQFPQPFVPLGSQIFSEFIANFFMAFLILSVRDENGADLKGGGFFVIAFFWLNFVVMAAFGWETGSPINPARDLMGRTWLAILGYKNAWSAYNYYFWIPFFIPFIACFLGALTYDIFIYTGDSPINNGEWSPGKVHKRLRRTFRRDFRGHQSDEENLNARQNQGIAASTPMVENEERHPSRPNLQGIHSVKSHQETEANHEDMENDPNSWEDTERHGDQVQDAEHLHRNTPQRSNASGHDLEGKQTGYDDPHRDGGEEADRDDTEM
ncbi:hypothetical protein KVR01_000012 [Diaporthe batatas]|uniref:uncharacterized protein n=1 Tax=Diaporthe batatas TaxID=748121 RepID=UPI001D042E2F|nr:uncharacterized protein KVR01_000012 [Diaporthe batatas]KAG8169267.1 hypothetical protein KVR01_000012 [Diaporthe batatas]